ncbi:hypothetical protein ACHAQA_004399 [Verticillium albo-atrum]
MKQNEIQPPKVTSGAGYPEAFALKLDTELAALRKAIAAQSGKGLLFDQKVNIDTPDLGDGRVESSICLPKSPHASPSESRPLPLILLLEGGGFVLGQPNDGEANARLLSDRLNAIVVSVNYAKAPAYPFPHALLQAYEVLKWSLSPAATATFGTAADPSRTTILGCSAGGNLATSLSLLLAFTAGPSASFREALGLQFRQVAQVLIYPCLALQEKYGARFARASPEAQARSIPVTILEMMEAAYVPPYVDGRQVFVAPMLAEADLLRELQPNLAPSLIIIAGLDALDREAAEYSEQLEAAGVEVVTKTYPEAVHAYTHAKEGQEGWRGDDVKDTWDQVCAFISSKTGGQ